MGTVWTIFQYFANTHTHFVRKHDSHFHFSIINIFEINFRHVLASLTSKSQNSVDILLPWITKCRCNQLLWKIHQNNSSLWNISKLVVNSLLLCWFWKTNHYNYIGRKMYSYVVLKKRDDMVNAWNLANFRIYLYGILDLRYLFKNINFLGCFSPNFSLFHFIII